MKRKALTAVFMAALLAMGLTACSSGGGSTDSASESDTIRIGCAIPLTGASAQDGQSIQNGAQIAVDQVNEAGGIDGKQVELVVEDDKGDSSEAATVANLLAEDSTISAVVGHFNSSCTLAGAPIYNQAGVVEISPGSSAAAVTDAGDYTFRVITTDAVQGRYLAEWAVNDLGYQNIAVLYENTDYGLGLAQVLEEAMADLGANIVVQEAYEVGATDYSTVLTKVASSEAEAIIIGGLYNETALIAKQRSSFGLENMQIMGVDAIYSDALIELGGDAANGILLTGYFSDASTSQVAQDFIAAYEEAYGEMPATYAAYGYDAALVILDAIQNVGADRAAIQEYLSTLEGLEGATGINSFDENGDVIKDPMRMTIENGEFVVIE